MSSISRIAKTAIELPTGVTVAIDGDEVTVKGPKGSVKKKILSNGVTLDIINGGKEAQVGASRNGVKAGTGTAAAHLKNLVKGVTTGFELKLELVGVGYRAQAQGKKLNLTLGFSHPVAFDVPEGITVETPSQTEILVKGADKNLVGLVAAKIRRYRSPEPYKGKGIRYAGEAIKVKEVKKK
ncbi:MAG: ribosomal protein [Gammaproteobacteria bacterium]|jgi:large subunit ribosomal protein L6|nr:ribosomal protein [Gammaproteobacteria bacterium]